MYSKMGRMGETPAVLSLPNLFLSFPSPLRIVTSRCLGCYSWKILESCMQLVHARGIWYNFFTSALLLANKTLSLRPLVLLCL